MLSTLPRFDISARFATHFCLGTICNRVICIFFTAALLLVWQVKAQIQASQLVDYARQLQSQNVDVRRSAAAALARIGPKAKEAAPALMAALKDQDAGVRRSAAKALGKIGPGAKEVSRSTNLYLDLVKNRQRDCRPRQRQEVHHSYTTLPLPDGSGSRGLGHSQDRQVRRSSAAPSLELEIEIEQKGVGRVEMGKVFQSGAWVRLVASPNQNELIYVLMKGTEGPAQILYPDAELKQNYEPAQAGWRIELPPSKPQIEGVPWFRFDDRPGVETLYVVFTTKPGDERLRALEAAIQQSRIRPERRGQLNAAEEQQTLSALEALVSGQSAAPTVTARKNLLRHEK